MFKLCSEKRRLLDSEILILCSIFSTFIEYNKVVVHEGNWITKITKRPFAIGNNIYFRSEGFIESSDLVHEAVHVWQFQKLYGWAYLLRAIFEQVLFTLKICDVYNFQRFLNQDGSFKKPFNKWFVESQAEYIEHFRKIPSEFFEVGQ